MVMIITKTLPSFPSWTSHQCQLPPHIPKNSLYILLKFMEHSLSEKQPWWYNLRFPVSSLDDIEQVVFNIAKHENHHKIKLVRDVIVGKAYPFLGRHHLEPPKERLLYDDTGKGLPKEDEFISVLRIHHS